MLLDKWPDVTAQGGWQVNALTANTTKRDTPQNGTVAE